MVEGGAKRTINLTSADDISLVSEFEQARSFKNIWLYLAPAQNFEWLDLTKVAFHKLPISIAFFTFGNIGNTPVRSLKILCTNAKINEIPDKRWDSAAKSKMLVVKFALPETRLIYHTRQGKEVVEEDW